MPRMKKATYDFLTPEPETFRDVVEDVITPPLLEIESNTNGIIPELKRIRRANELIVGQDVDEPED